MLPFVQVGPLVLQVPGLALLAGVWIGSTLAEREAARLKLNAHHFSNLIFVGLIGGVVGARLAYAGRYLSAYLADPLGLISLTPGTLWPEAGLLIGAAAAAVYGWRRRLSLRPALDALAPGLAIFMAAFHIANLLSGEAFGAAADLPWAIELWGARRHPAQAYELLGALGVLAIVWRRPLGAGGGLSFLLAVALTAAARVFLEAFRGDSVIWAGFRSAQLIGVAVAAACAWGLGRWGKENAGPAADSESLVAKGA